MIEVVVVGSTNWDIAMYLPTLPAAGETVAGGKLQSGLGGKGANQAVAAHLAGGAQTLFISCIGDDDIGNSVKQVFGSVDLSLEHVSVISETGTGSALIFVDADGENSIGIASGANASVTPEFLQSKRDILQDAKVVLLQLEIPMETVLAVADYCAESKAQLVLNPAPAQPLSPELLSRVDILTPNRVELAQISGMETNHVEQIEIAALDLCNKGVGAVVTTMGAEGSLIVSGNRVTQVPAHHVEAVDTTAAGDVFNGTMAAELAQGSNIEKSVRVAAIASALSVTRRGAIASIPARADVLALVKDSTG